MINADQFNWLNDALFIMTEEKSALSEWEQSFVADQSKRVAEYGYDTNMSVKQWAVLARIWHKLGYDNMPDGIPEHTGSR